MEGKFFVPLDEKRALESKAPIGISTNIKSSIFREILASSKNTRGTIGGISHLNGSSAQFNFPVEPGTIIDWDNCYALFDLFAYDPTTTATTGISDYSVGAFQLVNGINKLDATFSGVKCFDKGDEYKTSKLVDVYTRYSKKQIEQSKLLFQPAFDHYYTNPLIVPHREDTNEDIQHDAVIRRANIQPMFSTKGEIIEKAVPLSELYFSIGQTFLTNQKNIILNMGFKALNMLPYIPGSQAVIASEFSLYIHNVRLFVKQVEFTEKLGAEIKSMREKGMSDKIAYVNVKVEHTTLSKEMKTANVKNAQFYGILQHAEDLYVDTDTTVSLGCPGQLSIGNAQANTTATVDNDIHCLNSNNISTTQLLIQPPNSIHFKYGKYVVPDDPIVIRAGSTAGTYRLNTNQSYEEYKNVNGNEEPAISFEIYSRTTPLMVASHSDVNKLENSSNLNIILDGLGTLTDTNKTAELFWGESVYYEIAASTIGTEVQTSF